MKKLAVTLALIAFSGDVRAAPDPEAVLTGSLKMAVERGERSREYELELEQVGERLKARTP